MKTEYLSIPAITNVEKETRNGHSACIIWLTGLSGAGKSTIAANTEKELFALGIYTHILDGDNLRTGISNGLSFSPDGRSENIRRTSEVAKLFNDAGIVVITALISPYTKDRDMARAIIGIDRFIEVFVDAPIDCCIVRDPKGLYKKAIAGTIPVFTGISDVYEHPEHPALHLHTQISSITECVRTLTDIVIQKTALESNDTSGIIIGRVGLHHS